MSDLARLEYVDGRVIVSRCFSEDFNAEVKALPKGERGFDWDAMHWWADAVHAEAIRKMMNRYFGAVAVFGHPKHGDCVFDRDGTVALQDSLFG